MKSSRLLAAALAVATAAGCAEMAKLPLEAGFGARPALPPPQTSLLPTVNIAPARGWPSGQAPRPAEGLGVQAYASGLQHPRSLLVLPNGDVLVAETDAPARPEDSKGVKGWIAQQVMQKAGSNRKSANRITLLRDEDGDGVAETRRVFLTGLNSPFGMALVGNQLYIANTDAVVRYPYRPGQTSLQGVAPARVAGLPAGPINHHWTKDLVASADGRKLYVSVGSNSNIAENGLENETDRAAILEIDAASGNTRVFASGLRNANGLGWNPQTGALWGAVNERDELGSDLVPDYITSIRDGGFYGWPWSYYGQHVDERVKPARPDMVAKALVPDYAVGAHTAPLGMCFYRATLFPERFHNGAFVSQHGSWNRRPKSGYKVIFVPFRDGQPTGMPVDVLGGFLDGDEHALGRPVGLAVDRKGALLVADDVGGVVWRVAPSP